MNKKFTKLMAALALLVFMAPNMVGWGQNYEITFKTGSGDGTSASTSTPCSTIVSAGSDYLTGNLATATKVYYSGDYGLKLGASSNAGVIKMNLSSSGQVTPTSIVVNAKLYNSSKAATLKVNGSQTQNVTSDFSDLTFNITDAITYLQLESSKYIWVSSITVNYSGGGTGTATTTTISDASITNTNVYTSQDAGSLSATVTVAEGGATVSGATVTWSGDNDDVATINETTGVVTLVAAGTVTFTASYAGDDDYNASSATYEMTVTNVNPNLTTIWSEDFSSYEAGNVPSGGTYSYACVNGGSDTRIFGDSYAGGTSPELLVGKSGGSFTATIPLLTSTYGYSGDLTLTYKTNAKSLNVKTTTTGLTVDGEASAGAGLTYSTLGEHTIIFKGVTTSTENITIVFTPGGDNVRLDDIVLKGEQAPLTTVATPVISPNGGAVVSGTEVTITCATEGASIYYTTDGSTPTSSSTPYNPSSKPTITTATTLKAIAVKYGMDDSNVAEAEYTIIYTLTVGIDHVEYGLYDYTTGEWNDIEVDSENHALVLQGAEVRISVDMVDDCYVLNGFSVTAGNTTIQATDHMDDDGTYGFTMPASDAVLSALIEEADEYTLTVVGLDKVNYTYLLKGSESEEITLDANNQASICEQSNVEVVGLTANSDYVLQSVTLTYGNETVEVTPEYGVYAFNMPSSDATLTFVMGTAPVAVDYQLYSGNLVEGDYIIYYNEYVMKNTVSGNRLGYEMVTPNNDVIATNDATIVWHIAPSGGYWTIYNANVQKYAASTGTKNQAQMVADGTDNKALWTVTGTSTYEFVNKNNSSNNVNANLRNNEAYGFACYASGTGGALSLYKKVTASSGTEIEGHGTDIDRGWHFIASPVAENLTATISAGTEGTDLYYYDEQNHMWRNYKQAVNASYFDFAIGKGYLYANTETVNVTFEGAMPAASLTQVPVLLDYHTKTSEGANNSLAGWNLVGNPFNSNAILDMDCYIISGTEINTEAQTAGSYTVAPCEGVLVKATAAGQMVTFTKSTGQIPQPNQLQMIVAQQVMSRGTATSTVNDNAIVSFNEGNRLEKFVFNADAAKLYIPQNGKEYAIVSAEAQGEMPVNFRATKNGTYTLTINPEGVEMNYLHLIDNMTGANIDLLQTPSYTFNASMNDYESRFKLVFAAGSSTGSEASETFAFFTNGELIVNNEGEATLQVVDMTGRILSSQSLNGNGSVQMAAPVGVYVLRLINGNEVKTQKIVVR